MTTVYLNWEFRKKIEKKIKEDVEKNVFNSATGKELKQMKKKIVSGLRKLVKKQCPSSDIEVLKKYDLATEHECLKVELDSENIPKDPYFRSNGVFKVEIKPALVSQDIRNSNFFLISLINNDKSLKEIVVTAFKINDSLTCEVKETVFAYMRRVERFRTVKTLLGKYPAMKKYIPKPEKKEKKEVPAEEKTIALYEES